MCPSYQVTHEEEHCTRGRARLLWEMLNGRELKDGWKSDAVKHSLDLCLSCKGCKGECPVQVDMATYKAEFLSHYYAHRLRPREQPAVAAARRPRVLSGWQRRGAADRPRASDVRLVLPARGRTAQMTAWRPGAAVRRV